MFICTLGWWTLFGGLVYVHWYGCLVDSFGEDPVLSFSGDSLLVVAEFSHICVCKLYFAR